MTRSVHSHEQLQNLSTQLKRELADGERGDRHFRSLGTETFLDTVVETIPAVLFVKDARPTFASSS